MQDGRFNIDNNLMEQAIRPITLGRKKTTCSAVTKREQRTILSSIPSWCVAGK
ncbi:IS66 family transposase [Hoylesella buccalis]|uniref:IS66 family transposase n=1 Tax=Hoylesella buccalis TaxID=28127 RepID=UPI00399CF1FF